MTPGIAAIRSTIACCVRVVRSNIGTAGVDLHELDRFRLGEARIHTIQRDEGPNHQPGADKEDERHRDLRHHQHAARPLTITSVAHGAAAARQRRGEPRIRVPHDGQQPETDARQKRHAAREDERDAIDANFLEARKFAPLSDNTTRKAP